jgi:hypothetical protein
MQSHLFPQGNGIIHTLSVGEKNHHHVYGLGSRTKYEKVRKFIRNSINQRSGPNVFFTMFFDLYGLPTDFPGKNTHVRNAADPMPYVLALEEAFRIDVDYFRFIPHLQLYEYETILFADPEAFAVSFENCAAEIQQLKAIAALEASIENINDGRETAPSKRIISIIPEYDGRKASAGPDIAEYIGIEKIRAECPHFATWLAQLENIGWESE